MSDATTGRGAMSKSQTVSRPDDDVDAWRRRLLLTPVLAALPFALSSTAAEAGKRGQERLASPHALSHR
jgi:hypothetical protein